MSEMTPNGEPTRTPAVKRTTAQPQQPSAYPGPAPDPPRILGSASIVLAFLIIVVVGSIIGSCFLVYNMIGSVADLPGRVIGGVRESLEAGDPTYLGWLAGCLEE